MPARGAFAALERMQSEIQEQNKLPQLNWSTSRFLSRWVALTARLFMYQSNFRLAEQDVQIARPACRSSG
jgi:hypothetical protein